MVNDLEKQAYTTKKIEKPLWGDDDDDKTKIADIIKSSIREIPEDLKCPVCKDLLKDCIMMPACACAICDECARWVDKFLQKF